MSHSPAVPTSPTAHTHPGWFAIYTRSRQENRVADQLQQKDFRILLPLYERYSRWSDRIQRISAPLFPGYVFAQIPDTEHARVLQTKGVVNLVSVGGRPTPLPDNDVELLRRCLACPSEIEPHPYVRIGHKVRILTGPFAGWEGILAEKKNSARVLVTVEHIMQSIAVNLHVVDIESVA